MNPFVGLRPFSPTDGRRLFGRDGDLALVADRVLSTRTTLLFAGSGAGKTSFLNAKLIPEMTDRYQVFVCRHWTGVPPKPAIVRAVAEQLTITQRTDDALQQALKSPDTSLISLFKCLDPDGTLLILDQFEEVFARGWDERFNVFLDELSELITDEDIDVRVVFSMREEFLGELSVFDNRIPDLFSNYYRLKHPTRDQGFSIIQQTCAQEGVSVNRDALKALVTDLSKVMRSSTRTTGAKGSRALHEVETDHVILPYTQLVCEQLWAALPSGAEFPAGYRPGDAAQVRDQFCEGKLSKLDDRDQEILSRALEHLVTRRGAKMPYEVGSLAEMIRVKRSGLATLRALLQYLADDQPPPRILKDTEAEGTLWFELYHDMYAPVLFRWKERFERLQEVRRKQRARQESRGVRPDEIAEWEQETFPLDEFWVYLPDFLAGGSDGVSAQIISVMATNLVNKNTRYLYIVEDRDDVIRLLDLVQRLRGLEVTRKIDVGAKVSVLVLHGLGENGAAQAVSGLLHLGNCWIANPRTTAAEGYEVAFDDHGSEPTGGRKLPVHKLRRIVKNVTSITEAFPPPTFQHCQSEADIVGMIDRSPVIMITRTSKRL